ncbi:MAG: Ig-like domain-containing protein, partial [Solirubrobacterales bacterium]
SQPLSAGSNTITVTCTDDAGNSGSDSVTVVRDNVDPVVTITSPANNTVTAASSIAVSYTVTDNVTASPSCNIASGSSQPLSAGSNTITVTCTDDAGNSGSDSVTVIRDNVAPVVDITSPADGSTVAPGDYPLTFTVSDNIDASPSCDFTSGDDVTVAAGSNTFTVSCTDDAGNVGSDSITVTGLLAVAPDTEITTYANPSFGTPPSGPPSNPASPALNVSFTGTESPTSFECRVDAGPWSTCSSPWTVPTAGLTSPAEHTYEIRGINGAGTDATPALGYFWYDNRDFTAVPTVAAEPNSLEPTAADADDAGAHPNISASLQVHGYEDGQSLEIVGPDGLMGSLKSIPPANRCDVDDFRDFGTCPASARIGSFSGTAMGAIDGQVSASGDLYLIQPEINPADGITADDAAGVALVMDSITGPVSGDLGDILALGTLRINDQGRNLRILVPDIPRETTTGFRFHVLEASLTIEGDTRPNMAAPPSSSNPPLLTNPHICSAVAGRANYNLFVGSGTGYNGSTTPPITASYVVDNCGAVPFTPALNWSLSNPAAGQGTEVSADMTLPFDHSPLQVVQATLPGFVGTNLAGLGDTTNDQCPVDTIVGDTAGEPGAIPGVIYFDFDNPANPCPTQARVGTAELVSPLIDDPIQADVWLVSKSPIPNIGISVSADTPGNPQGVKLGLIGTTQSVSLPLPAGCDDFFVSCDQAIRTLFNSIPDVPVETLSLDIGTIPGRVGWMGAPISQYPLKIADASDGACRNSGAPATTLLAGWRGTPFASLSQTLFPTGCVNP